MSVIPPAVVRLASLADDLRHQFESWTGEGWPEDRFRDLALRVFELQYETNAPYRRYCAARGIEPAAVQDWRAIPPVPTAAFRRITVRSASTPDALTFLTSGTSRGLDSRGRHYVPWPDLYRASLRAPFRRFVLPDVGLPVRMLALVPSFSTTGDSSLAWMIDDVMAGLGAPESRSFASPGGVDWDALSTACRTSEAMNTPVCLLGTTVGFAAWSAWLEQREHRFALPDGSRLMDTGGAKGLSALDRDDVMRRLILRLGLGEQDLVNEFGMTELLSQYYAHGLGELHHEGPPWLRTRVLDPVTLAEMAEGEEGILCHYDLANAGSVLAVLTEDRGRVEGDMLIWLGRTPGSPPRGCSLATAELLEAQRDA